MKLDLPELLTAVVAAYFIGLTIYVHEATYGSGSFLVTPSMIGVCYADDGKTPIQCDAIPEWYEFEDAKEVFPPRTDVLPLRVDRSPSM